MESNLQKVPRRYIAQTPPEQSFCAGCATCEIVCALTRDGVVSPSRNRIFMERDGRSMVHTIHSCQHCDDAPCYEKCPKKGVAMIKGDDGIVHIDEGECIGCGQCAGACVFDPPRINFVKAASKSERKARKCDLCRGRAEGPACVQWCPVRCIYVAEVEA